jgi:hypothetical protein
VLAYEQYADTAAGGQVAKVDAAIDEVAQDTGASWEKTVAADAQDVADGLPGYDVLLVYRQGKATDAQLAAVGVLWLAPLWSHLATGGIVIFTEGPGSNQGTWTIFDAADVFACAGRQDVSGGTGVVLDPGDYVAPGVTSYLASKNSSSFLTSEESVVVADKMSGNPLVVHKVVLP